MSEYYNAFISYGRADSKFFATKLYEKLTENGLKIWFDQNDIPLGVDFQNQIDDGITKADNFLFIIAPHSVNSPYCLKEINHAIKYNKRIIPLLHVEQI
ncbi:MAG: toll/interleukin-1 receptor domain-containing protein, partial [Okeania sp. SIO3I5]|uniref:toll/interleukin-1 receptor domain-containing protein n=1 Tax=Okeania sp. SIO3I5 TaxID=2607805 RepID=UPI0013BB8363